MPLVKLLFLEAETLHVFYRKGGVVWNFSLFILLLFFLVSCQSEANQPSSTNPNESNTTEEAKEETEWEKYVNSRFNFSINYPSDWTIGQESQNGDGVNLYIGNRDIRILVYGSNYNVETTDPYLNANREGFQRQWLVLDNGLDAALILGKENGKVIYEMVLIEEGIEYNFYAEMSEKFFNENEKLLIKVIKGFDI